MVHEGLDLLERMPPNELLAHVALQGLRVATERSRSAPARRSPRADAELRHDVARYEAVLTRYTSGRLDRPVEAAVQAAWAAERSRFAGAPDAALWDESVRRWDAVAWPRPALLAQLQAIEARLADAELRPTGRDAIPEATARAEALGSKLLVGRVADIARRAGVAAGPPDPVLDLRDGPDELTAREREVLDLLATGATNRQIADALFISTKTASVHVSRILTKLGVASRSEAASRAGRVR